MRHKEATEPLEPLCHYAQVVESLDRLGRWPSFLRPIFCRKLLKNYIESAGSTWAFELIELVTRVQVVWFRFRTLKIIVNM